MREVTDKNFGILTAFILPGLVVLWGMSHFSDTVRGWLSAAQGTGLTVGGFLFATLGSLAAGLTLSAVRWASIDTLHHSTGIKKPTLDFGILHERLATFEAVVSNHYRYYQFYANMLVAVAFLFCCELAIPRPWPAGTTASWLGLIVIECVLFFGSRDALHKYYERSARVLGPLDPRSKGGENHDQRLAPSRRNADTENQALVKNGDGSGREARKAHKKAAREQVEQVTAA